MGGVDNLRPPKPKPSTTWKVEVVLDYLEQMGEDKDISWGEQNLKLATTLALANYKRASDLYILDTKFCTVTDDVIIFDLQERPKQHRKRGRTPKPVRFDPSHEPLCPVQGLKSYLERTKQARDGEGQSRLFLSHLEPHKPVGRDTIRRWLKTVLAKAGIDTSIFKGHSIRSSASSDARDKGASIDDILRRGGWSTQRTWRKYYYRQSMP